MFYLLAGQFRPCAKVDVLGLKFGESVYCILGNEYHQLRQVAIMESFPVR